MYEFAVIGDGGKQTSTLNVFGSSPAHALKRAKIMANPMRVYPLNATKPKAANDDGQPDVIKEAA